MTRWNISSPTDLIADSLIIENLECTGEAFWRDINMSVWTPTMFYSSVKPSELDDLKD